MWHLIGLLLVLSSTLRGQGAAGSVTGLVTDPSDSVVANVKVGLRNLDTGLTTSATSNNEGAYNFPSVPRGRYELSAEAQGFKKLTLGAVLVEGAAVRRIDLRLEVGSVTEVVGVSAELPLLQTETSQTTSVVNRKLLDRVPFQLAGTNRDVSSFIRLVPGVSVANNFGIVMTGGRQHSGEMLVDGVTNT